MPRLTGCGPLATCMCLQLFFAGHDGLAEHGGQVPRVGYTPGSRIHSVVYMCMYVVWSTCVCMFVCLGLCVCVYMCVQVYM